VAVAGGEWVGGCPRQGTGGAELWVGALSLRFASHSAVVPRSGGGWGEASSSYIPMSFGLCL